MGVPGLWRILDLASQPLDLEKCSGLRIAIDINSYANRLVHSQSASNWIYILARDFFRILHFNIKIIIVFMGRRPLDKIYRYSTSLGDESQDASYYRVRSLILRSNKDSPQREPKAEAEKSEPLLIPMAKFPPRKRVLAHLEDAEDINEISKRQIESISQAKPLPSVQVIHHSNYTSNYIFFEKDNQPKEQPTNSEIKTPRKDFDLQKPQDQTSNQFYSSLLDDVKDIISESDPSSEGAIPIDQQQDQPPPIDTMPISLLPADDTYFPPIENYVTATHIRLIEKLCDLLGIEYIQSPEEACAECARLEQEGIVDAVASDDNNSVLFGSKWLIRGIFTRPQSLTIGSLENVGITRNRMIMIAMMIDGDYNMDIRKRLFTVGPVRGMEILSLFPDEKDGLYQFKDWWISVVKNKKEEENPRLRRLAKKKWMNKLIMPENFPPIELLNAFKEPKVSDSKPKARSPKFDVDDVVNFIRQSSSISEERIREHTTNFAKRMESFKATDNSLFIYSLNIVKQSQTFQTYIDRIVLYDKKMKKKLNKDKQIINNGNNSDDEWETVSETEKETETSSDEKSKVVKQQDKSNENDDEWQTASETETSDDEKRKVVKKPNINNDDGDKIECEDEWETASEDESKPDKSGETNKSSNEEEETDSIVDSDSIEDDSIEEEN